MPVRWPGIKGRKGPPTVPWCQKVGGPFRSCDRENLNPVESLIPKNAASGAYK